MCSELLLALIFLTLCNIYNGNWTEWSAIWAEIIHMYVRFQNQMSTQCEFDFKSQVWFQTKIAQHKVQFQLYYIHFEIAQIQDLVSSNILLMYWAGLKLNSSIFFGGGGIRVLETKVAKFATWYILCLSFSCNLIGCFEQALKSNCLFCF